MAMDKEYDDEPDDEEREVSRPRSAPPRYGPFLTIAVAILMLFGAASRFGTTESGSWLNLDFLASRSIEQDRLRLQEQRNLTLVTLGAVPTAAPHAAAPAAADLAAGVPLSSRAVLPPSRGAFDLQEYEQEQQARRRADNQLSMPIPLGDNNGAGVDRAPPAYFDPVPEAERKKESGTYYEVRPGDNWVKIGKATGARWQDIQSANPSSKNGLRVGMKLVIP